MSIWPLRTNFSESLNTKPFIDENVSENIVWEIAAILSREMSFNHNPCCSRLSLPSLVCVLCTDANRQDISINITITCSSHVIPTNQQLLHLLTSWRYFCTGCMFPVLYSACYHWSQLCQMNLINNGYMSSVELFQVFQVWFLSQQAIAKPMFAHLSVAYRRHSASSNLLRMSDAYMHRWTLSV